MVLPLEPTGVPGVDLVEHAHEVRPRPEVARASTMRDPPPPRQHDVLGRLASSSLR
jgi:hypothetical protein